MVKRKSLKPHGLWSEVKGFSANLATFLVCEGVVELL